jgi:hypothetical protein
VGSHDVRLDRLRFHGDRIEQALDTFTTEYCAVPMNYNHVFGAVDNAQAANAVFSEVAYDLAVAVCSIQ